MRDTRQPARVAVIGDVAGHLVALRAELVRLGADPSTGRLPDDLTVVQVGDLVHRGPQSEGVVALVDAYLDHQPGQWIQLAGNHEAQYLREPVFSWPERIGDDAAASLRRWWAAGTMRAAAAVRTPHEDFLITHAGLTAGFWREAMDRPRDVAQAVRAINSFAGSHDEVLFHAGSMLGGGEPDLTAGPMWAACASELVPSWMRTEVLPFSQVHGHSTLVDWKRRRLRCSPAVAEITTLDEEAAHATVTVRGGRIVGVDPGHGKRARKTWRAFVLDDAQVHA